MPGKQVRDMAKTLGQRGGEARARALSKERRKEIAMLGAKERWRKRRKPK
jgi:general stress protein YciG